MIEPKRSRSWFFLGALVFVFTLLFIRLFHLQIISGKENRERADGNRFRQEILPSVRGIIYDRESRQLVRNIPLVRIAKRDNGIISGWEALDREEALRKEAAGESELRFDAAREYIFGPATAHVLGYLGETNEEEVKSGKYRLGDLVGRLGIERQYDLSLRGKDGAIIQEVDSLGRVQRTVSVADPIPGADLHLSIDAELSRQALIAMEGKPSDSEGKPGAVVVSLVKTGEVLALVSSPSFDPNSPVLVLSDPSRPMFNRAIAGLYPPGSTFKIVTSTAGLESGKINANTLITDTGQIRIGDFVYRNWYFTQYGRTEGEINIVKAIQRSTDTFFYKVGEMVGPEEMADWARKFGLGKASGIDLAGEAAGVVPDPEWKQKTLGERWFLGNTYHMAIGQGNLLVTPLQINAMTATIANGGKWCRPTVRVEDGNSPALLLSRSSTLSECRDLGIKPETIGLIKEGMVGACSPGGTAYPLFDIAIEGLPAGRQVACKTGTAEYGDKNGKTHAWLTAFAPIDDPQIAVTVLVEGGGEGSAVAAPIARKVLEKYFEGKR